MGGMDRRDDKGRWRGGEIASLVVFIVGLAGLLPMLYMLMLVLDEWHIPDPGDARIGMIFVGCPAALVALIFLVASVSLSLRARRLPAWLRVAMVLSPALAFLSALIIVYRGVWT